MLFEFNNALEGFSCTLIEFCIQFIKCYRLCAEFKSPYAQFTRPFAEFNSAHCLLKSPNGLNNSFNRL